MEIEIIKWGAYVLVGILGWLLRILWEAQEKLRKDFTELEKNLPIAYVPREQFKDIVKEVKEGFKEAVNPILNKLDRMEERIENVEKRVRE